MFTQSCDIFKSYLKVLLECPWRIGIRALIWKTIGVIHVQLIHVHRYSDTNALMFYILHNN